LPTMSFRNLLASQEIGSRIPSAYQKQPILFTNFEKV
jgi:hypothetical protein